MSSSTEKCLQSSAYNSLLTLAGVSASASAMRSSALSDGRNLSSSPRKRKPISSSLSPYVLPPAELMSIQNGHPTRTAVRNCTSERCRSGTLDFWPSNHSLIAFTQKTRGTRAIIFCGVRSFPNILWTCLNTNLIRNEVFLGSIPSTRAMLPPLDVAKPTIALCIGYDK